MRKDLVRDLAYELRDAENYYLRTQDGSKKHEVFDKIKRANLTEEEKQEFREIAESMGC
jgi:hypothetical protein